MKTLLHVEGMSCGHCEQAVSGALKEINGVTAVTVVLDAGTVEVSHEETVTRAQLADAIDEQGFDVQS